MAFDFPNAPAINQSVNAPSGGTFVWDGTKWKPNASAVQPPNTYLPLAGGTMTGGLNLTATGSTISRSVQARFAETVNVVDYGADPTGTTDSAPMFRACMGSNRRIVVPPGTYLFNSTLSLPAPYGVGANPGVIVASFTNFEIAGYGATITFGTSITTGGQQANQMAAFLFDRCTGFSVKGLTIQGNVTGLAIPSQPNVGLFCMSCTDFTFEHIHFTGYFVYAIDGDWWVNALFRNIVVDGAIYGFDVAYLYRCVFDNCRTTGSDCVGTGPTHVGNGGFSCIVDPPNAGTNFTAIPTASFTAHNTYRNCSATNFSTGWYATTGRYYLLQGNRWFNNPGLTSPSTPGIGVFFGYDSATSVGVPISNCVVDGDTFSGNGTNVAGQGIRFANPSGSDFTSDITIANCQFDNNTNIAISGAASNSNVRRLQAIGNTFTGANQTTGIAAGILSSFTAIVDGTTIVSAGPARFNGTIGFNNTAPIARPTVSGAKGSNAALASLMAALAAYGLVTDSTTA